MKEPTQLSYSAKLRIARAWMNEHGFSPYTYENGMVCFIGAIIYSNASSEVAPLAQLLRPHLRSQLPLLRRIFSADAAFPSFASRWLIDNKFNTKKALAVFDAAIAHAERNEA